MCYQMGKNEKTIIEDDEATKQQKKIIKKGLTIA